jgi:hypothetical protein
MRVALIGGRGRQADHQFIQSARDPPMPAVVRSSNRRFIAGIPCADRGIIQLAEAPGSQTLMATVAQIVRRLAGRMGREIAAAPPHIRAAG